MITSKDLLPQLGTIIQPVCHSFLIRLSEAVEFYAAFISVSKVYNCSIEKIVCYAWTDGALFITIRVSNPQTILEIGREIGFYQRFPNIIEQVIPNYK